MGFVGRGPQERKYDEMWWMYDDAAILTPRSDGQLTNGGVGKTKGIFPTKTFFYDDEIVEGITSIWYSVCSVELRVNEILLLCD